MHNAHQFFVSYTPKDRAYTIRWDTDRLLVKDRILYFEVEGEQLQPIEVDKIQRLEIVAPQKES